MSVGLGSPLATIFTLSPSEYCRIVATVWSHCAPRTHGPWLHQPGRERREAGTRSRKSRPMVPIKNSVSLKRCLILEGKEGLNKQGWLDSEGGQLVPGKIGDGRPGHPLATVGTLKNSTLNYLWLSKTKAGFRWLFHDDLASGEPLMTKGLKLTPEWPPKWGQEARDKGGYFSVDFILANC